MFYSYIFVPSILTSVSSNQSNMTRILNHYSNSTVKHFVLHDRPRYLHSIFFWRTETPGFDLCTRRNTWPQQPTSSCPAPVREPSSRLPEDGRWAGPPSTCAPASQCKASRRCASARWGSSSTSRSVTIIWYREGSTLPCLLLKPYLLLMETGL